MVLVLLACGDREKDDTPVAAAAEPERRPERPEPIKKKDSRRPVFDLIDNRVLAHRFRDGAWVLAAGGGGFDKSIPWGRRMVVSTRGESPVALVGRRATLAVPERAAGGDVLRLVAVAERADTLAISSLGETVARVEIDAGWQELEVRLSAPIKSRLSFRARRSLNVGIAALALGSGDLEPLGEPGPILDLGAGDSLSYYIYIPEGAGLVGHAGGDCALAVEARTDSGEVTGGDLEPGGVLELSELGGEVARVDVALAGCDRGSISRLQLVAEAPEMVELPEGEPPANVLLWVMDTLRADRIKLFNPGARPEVPGMERLAARGVVFRHAWTQGNESQTSHASIWTSTYPATHGVRTAGQDQSFRIPSSLPTFGELLSGTGREVLALTANGMVTRGGGFARGFDVFENQMRDGTGKRRNGWIPVERLMPRALELLEPRSAPHVLFFGTIDTHKPWVGHQPWLDRYDPKPYRGKFKKAAWPGDLGLVRGSMRCTQVPRPRDLERINAIYDSAISYQDQALDQMLTWLSERGRLDDTLIILTADHGEELWEVGRCGHGASLRETLQWVPLIISYPKRLPSGVVVEEGVDTLDILPTVLELMGVDPPRSFQGASLVPLAAGHGRGYPRASYASQYEYAHAMRIGRYKLRVGRDSELYDLGADPGEKKNLAFVKTIAHQHLADALQLFLRNRERWKKASWGSASNLTAAGALALEPR